MKITREMDLNDFQAWSGATTTKEVIISNDKAEDFEYLIEECYPNGLSDTQLNDLLWFDSVWIYENLGIEN